ncbi:hypothetical protein KBB49_01295 [Candidatus Saccharibacteria bacterium]|jgi:hypothetical protein|nr:hypothetical protein [Candidatus Saccharibacteria bacterium]
MGELVDLEAYRGRVQLPGEGMLDGMSPQWLANLVFDNIENNLGSIAEIAGESAVLPITTRQVRAQIAETREDPAPYGVLNTQTRKDKVTVSVSNRLALLFADRFPEAESLESSGKVAALYATGALVAASAWLIENTGSENPELWDDNLQPDKREIYRFAGGVIVNQFGFTFSLPSERRGRKTIPVSPQQAGLINPLSIVEMRGYFNFAQVNE